MDYKKMPEQNMNDFFRNLKEYCKEKKKETYVPARDMLNINKKDIIIFEADLDKMDLDIIKNQKKRELIIPTDNLFLEIPKWKVEDENQILINIGGILLYEDKIENRKIIKGQTFWIIYNKKLNTTFIKPLAIVFIDGIEIQKGMGIQKIDAQLKFRVGSSWSNINTKEKIEAKMFDEIKEELAILIQKILLYLLIKIEKKNILLIKNGLL